MTKKVAFSILMPVYNTPHAYLLAALDSVLAQKYPHWELCIADDCSPDPQIRTILENYSRRDPRIHVSYRKQNGRIAVATNTALDMATADWLTFLDHDDLLLPDSLLYVAEAIEQNPDAQMFYSDEDRVTYDPVKKTNIFCNEHLKFSRFDKDLLLFQNYVCHLCVLKTARVRQIGGLRDGFNLSQDHDLVLRYTMDLDPAECVHIPRILYHWRFLLESSSSKNGIVKAEAKESRYKLVQEYLNRTEPGAVVVPYLPFHKIKFPLPQPAPLVSLILDCRNEEVLKNIKYTWTSLLEKTSYKKLEIFLLCKPDAPQIFLKKALTLPLYSRLRTPQIIFESSKIAEVTHGAVLGWLSGGIIGLTQNWLEDFVAVLAREGVGVIGGKLFGFEDHKFLHCGYLADAGGKLQKIFSAVDQDDICQYNWVFCAKIVDALDRFCFFTRKKIFLEQGGVDVQFGDFDFQAYCLRLQKIGLRTLWWSSVAFAVRSYAL